MSDYSQSQDGEDYDQDYDPQSNNDNRDEKIEFKDKDIVDEADLNNKLIDDLLNKDSDSEDEINYRGKQKESKKKDDDQNSLPDFMFFDFRRGVEKFPPNCEIVDPAKAERLLEKQTSDALEALKSKKKESDESKGENEVTAVNWSCDTFSDDEGELNNSSELNNQLQDATFEILNDGSTALIIKPGDRLKLNLNELLEGGDASKESREKKKKKKKKFSKFSGGIGPMMGSGKSNSNFYDAFDDDNWASSKFFKFKKNINEYTITMDVKLKEDPPRDGISLFQTALIHVKENKRSGKSTLNRSEGECLINQAGGVGQLGTFGDTTTAKVESGKWNRIVVSVKCVEGKDKKGEMRTWINSEPAIAIKDDAFVANDRFSIDPDGLFIFSSSQGSMMPGNIALRTIRVELKFADDSYVKASRARDKICSMFIEDRIKEAEKQREGLALASLFAKPRPVWSAQPFYCFFGDDFVENTILENSDNLAWAYTVLNFTMQKMISQSILTDPRSNFDRKDRTIVSDVIHSMQQSIPIFKNMLKLLSKPNASMLQSFLRKLKSYLVEIKSGCTLLVPAVVEREELLIIVERTDDRVFRFIVMQTNPLAGLRHHAVSCQRGLKYRTCLVLSNVSKKNAFDDVFWMALYDMAIVPTEGDLDKFYDILIPFLTGKPLEASLVEAENSALLSEQLLDQCTQLASQIVENQINDEDQLTTDENLNILDKKYSEYLKQKSGFGTWRSPQKSQTAYVRCIVESIHYLHTRKGMSEVKVNQVLLALFCDLVSMMKNDLGFVIPEASGYRICKLALQELSYSAVKFEDLVKSNLVNFTNTQDFVVCVLNNKFSDIKENTSHLGLNNTSVKSLNYERLVPSTDFVISEIYSLVNSTKDILSNLRDIEIVPLPELELSIKPHPDPTNNPELTQFKDLVMWNIEQCEPDPGQALSLNKYIPIDFLQIPVRASTRREAVRAIRLCDRLSTLIENQSHCIKNYHFLIVSCIQHIFTQVVPVPKPRGVKLSKDEVYKSERSQRIESKKATKNTNTSKFKDKNSEENKNNSSESLPLIVEELDTSVGTAEQEKELDAPCIWDQPITYELQIELLLTLQRITEHFAASSMSIQQSRSFDGVCIIVPGCLAAIADAIIRQIATDEPSEVCSQLSGKTKYGVQLGIAGFGTSISTFATQCETIELHTAELSVARTAVLDYFQSPAQKRLEKIFTWEESCFNKTNKSLIKYLRMVSREIGLPASRPHTLLFDNMPQSSLIMKNYPELLYYRDIIFWWKFYLNTDRKSFFNYSEPDLPNKSITSWKRIQTQLRWLWDDTNLSYDVRSFGDISLYCKPKAKESGSKKSQKEDIPLHRFPSKATPSFYLEDTVVKSEDDVIYIPNLPNFEDKHGQVLNQRDSELLISYLTVPYIRLPLILTFFSTEDRIHKLQNKELRGIFDAILFEPGKYLRMDMTNVEPLVVPTQHSDLLSTSFGLLFNELVKSPDNVLRSILNLLRGALACDTGSVADIEADDFNASTRIILYISLLGSRVDNYLSFIIDHHTKEHECIIHELRGNNLTQEIIDLLVEGRKNVRQLLHAQFVPLLEDYLSRLEREITNDPTNEKLISRNSKLACDIHAHKFIIYRNYLNKDYSASVVKTIIGSFLYLTTRHTWNKSFEASTLLVPEVEMYEALYVVRRRVVNWMTKCRQGVCDEVMQTALQVSSSLTGNLNAGAELIESQNRWSRIVGDRSIGRWAVGSTRTVAAASDALDDKSDGEFNPHKLQRQSSYDNVVGEVGDSSMLGVEIDVQVGQMTLKSKHLSALPTEVANISDISILFGESTIQASILEMSTHRNRYKLIGLNHELEYWITVHTLCPALGDEWEREYDPAELYDSEKWILPIFEPIRKSFFVQNSPFDPPTMQFMMPSKIIADEAEVVVLLGLHQKLGGPYKLVYIFRRFKCLHVYEILSHGREWWFSMHLTTDTRFSLTELTPNTKDRRVQYPDWWIKGAGSPYPVGVDAHLYNDLDTKSSLCVLIKRDPEHHLNISGGVETYIPPRLLYGSIPDALLDTYYFWQDESSNFQNYTEEELKNSELGLGYKKMRGYPIDKDHEYMIIVEIKCHSNFQDYTTAKSKEYLNDPNVIQSTCFPGRTITIIRRPKALMLEEFELKSKIASFIESNSIIIPSTDKKQKVKKVTKKTEVFKLDSIVECDYAQNGEYITCSIVKINDDRTYNVEYKGEYKWIGVQKNVKNEFIRKKEEKKSTSYFYWEGISDDEKAIWRDNSDDENQDNDMDNLSNKFKLDFFNFNEISSLLKIVKNDDELLMQALRYLTKVPGVNKFDSVKKVARALSGLDFVKSEVESIPTPEPYDKEDMVLINLLYIPRRSRLFSLVNSLTRIEILGQILAWTKLSNEGVKRPDNYRGIEFGCPTLDAIELPRLKLIFTEKPDHDGVLRLYSVDHVDLYVTTTTSASIQDILQGIPHSLLMTNVRGESQVLVPVIPPYRPQILVEPFSTFTVLCHSDVLLLAERFFLYPIHVSFSFLMTKGLNSAIYLILLRFIHRDYTEVFRLSDSIATDTKLNDEGLIIFSALSRINDDHHPDAHACRLKISLVVIDANMEMPWDLTTECAKYSLKIDRVSTSCRLSPQEELQLLESDLVALSETSPVFNAEKHNIYLVSVNFNRKELISTVLQNSSGTESSLTVKCSIPPRYLSSTWPFYQDNSVFGEDYAKSKEITSIAGQENSWQFEVFDINNDIDSPPKGWLVVVLFHTLWSAACIKLMPIVTEVVPMFQDAVSFLSVRADCHELSSLSKKMSITNFPSVILFRGGIEVDRIVGEDRFIEKFIRAINFNLTPDDKMCNMKRKHRIRLEKSLELGVPLDDEFNNEEETQGQIEWTWDSENCSSSMNIINNGMTIILKEDTNLQDRVVWEYSTNMNRSNSKKWIPLKPDTQARLEKVYKSGKIYKNGYVELKGGTESIELGPEINISSFYVTGFEGSLENRYCSVRRVGDRLSAPGEEQFLSDEQKLNDKRVAEWKDKWEMQKKKIAEQTIGHDVESIRGTTGFLANSGVHFWNLKWEHIPGREGISDSFGICSDYFESFGPTNSPLLGGTADAGTSIALYSDGKLFHRGKILYQIDDLKAFYEFEEAKNDSNEQVKSDSSETNSEQEQVQVENESVETKTDQAQENEQTSPVADPSETTTPVKPKSSMMIPESSTGNPLLFGKSSIVKCEFDSNLEGGTIRFYVNEKKIDFELSNVYTLLGGTEIFPIISVCPLDNYIPTQATKESSKNKKKSKSKKNKDEENSDDEEEEKNEGDEEENEKDEENEDEDNEEEEEGEEDDDDDEINESLPSVTLLLFEEEKSCKKEADVKVPKQINQNSDIEERERSNTEDAKERVENENVNDNENSNAKDEQDQNQIPVKKEIPKISEITTENENIRWMYETDNCWIVYPDLISKDIENASRESKSEFLLEIGETTHKCFLDSKKYEVLNDGTNKLRRLRRHILSQNTIERMWETVSIKYEKPYALYGPSIIQMFEKVRISQETMNGQFAGLGFLFLYSLLSGDMKCKINTGFSSGGMGNGMISSYSVMPMEMSSFGKGRSKFEGSSNDAHRLAILLTQFYADKHTKSLLGSIVNVLCRNRHVALRMPRFKDNRKSAQTSIFNAWVDDLEPRSPLSDLFGKIVPLMMTLKRKGIFQFPPPPPHAELPPLPNAYHLKDFTNNLIKDFPSVFFVKPGLTDFGCTEHSIGEISASKIAQLAINCHHRLGSDILTPVLPTKVEDTDHFNKILRENNDRLIVIYFYTEWCRPCKQIKPIYNMLSIQNPVALFLKINVDECDYLASEFKVEVIPFVKFIRSHNPRPSSRVNQVNSMNAYKDEIHRNRSSGNLLVFEFYASYSSNVCDPIKQMLETAVDESPEKLRVVRVNIDNNDDVVEEANILSLPAVHFWAHGVQVGGIAGKNTSSRLTELVSQNLQKLSGESIKISFKPIPPVITNLGSLAIGDLTFLEKFSAMFNSVLKPSEKTLLEKYRSNSPNENLEEILSNISADSKLIQNLTHKPLNECENMISCLSRNDLGLSNINPILSFDVTRHEAANTAPAISVLNRFKDDVAAYANAANTESIIKISKLLDQDVFNYFKGDENAQIHLQQALDNLNLLSLKIQQLKDSDLRMVQDTIPLLHKAANWVYIHEADSAELKQKKTRFIMNKMATKNSEIWVEFLFGSLISSKGSEDLLKLNPFLSHETIDTMLTLITLTMFRANRLGHVNRCIGAIISLEGLLKKILSLDLSVRKKQEEILGPKLIQAGEDLAKNISLQRHYVNLTEKGLFSFDPRYLVFEFVWNIQLRKKQIEIVDDFRDCLDKGRSKVKQMIMGAGKTSVVAPLLALIIADGSSLVLSVVPKALVEMSRTRMRETFSSIMTKRIYTLEFDRSTKVKPSMRRSLENATVNRGIVVATPTTLKSIMLSYVEVLQLLKDPNLVSTKRIELVSQSEELSKILKLFKDGVMLLDEVDLILHPLKSELNFPTGDKYDLDGSEEGERWSLPIHLMDAIFFSHSGKAYTFERQGVALEILNKISASIKRGIEFKHVQRLPHIILLNNEFYFNDMMPLLAEWCYLWLQKQHLHGIDKSEAILYMIEGAAARSESSTKLNLIDLEIKKVKINLGELSSSPKLTSGYARSMSEEQNEEALFSISALQRSTSIRIQEDLPSFNLFNFQRKALEDAYAFADEHAQLINKIYDINEKIDQDRFDETSKITEIQTSIFNINKQIQDIECPRDNSLDNCVIVWCSHAFAPLRSNAGSKYSKSSVANTGLSAHSEAAVIAVCNLLEDMGYIIRRCWEMDEAVSRCRTLQKDKQLRCLILGGEEQNIGCGPKCNLNHNTAPCLKCGKPFIQHNGHKCLNKTRGSWALSTNKSSEAISNIDAVEVITLLTDKTTIYAKQNSELPASRVMVYTAHTSVQETTRMSLWNLGASVSEDPKVILKWVSSIPGWDSPNNSESAGSIQEETDPEIDGFDEKAQDEDRTTVEQKAQLEKIQLSSLKAEVDMLENKKLNIIHEDENFRKKLQVEANEKHLLLENSVNLRIYQLNKVESDLLNIINDQSKILLSEKAPKYYNGPHCGRDTALAIAWLDNYSNLPSTEKEQLDESNLILIHKYLLSIKNEKESLKKMLLAVKVVTHVTSPMHKKLLNLCHNWLATYLPHCLAKINRVSFGLLSSEDCRQAIKLDPHVPRSRLKLAVPFIGKDVPSKSSEFAHPDVIIGLTILAYRYSGLRKDDYIDIIDNLTSHFVREIGPARDRKSNIKHENWILSSGGAIRGLKSTRGGEIWDPKAYEVDLEGNNKEVVQLKFLQKSNQEQMDKLYNILKLEPLVIHDYLETSIFPLYMRNQKSKLSASGQSIGGDMLVGKRVGFSGTPSDLLPEELGRCDYETGDDGMMISTVLNPKSASFEHVPDKWTVEYLLERIATSENPRFNALIDTGALITGYSNKEVAKQLLDRGLSWCDGVVFLDDDDKQQVLVRATGRVVSADQCGVSLEKRFAFYDQIHTTGMDIKHVVNATAVITLGKDMVFRDYVQGAYRMRGIGNGQKIFVFIIPEVKELMERELKDAVITAEGSTHVLEDVVAWLIINTLRSEQTQWTMLCIQNIGNLYRKNAFEYLTRYTKSITSNQSESQKPTDFVEKVVEIINSGDTGDVDSSTHLKPQEIVETKEKNAVDSDSAFIASLNAANALKIFDESIDFSLEAGVPDPIPFESKLRNMLEDNDAFIMPKQHAIGYKIMEMVGQFSMIEGSANRLDTEQEREQEQEQEKEVEAKKDQQIEIEKFVDREYSRQEEHQNHWPFSILSKPMNTLDHPFYQLSDFKLRHQEPLTFSSSLMISKNYFNPNWTGLRRLKNVIMLLEYAPSISGDILRLKTSEDLNIVLDKTQEQILKKAHTLLGFHASASGHTAYLIKEDLKLAIQAIIDRVPSDVFLEHVISKFSSSKDMISLDDFRNILISGELLPQHHGRYYVAVSLAEAETIRKILHVRSGKSLDESTQIALRYSPISTPEFQNAGGDGGIIFDVTSKWKIGTSATIYEAALAHSSFRFFDGDMHFSNPAINILIRVLQGSTRDKEKFYFAINGVKRRLDRKWQDTPLAKLFTISDEWLALKQRAQAIYMVEALKAKNLTFWEAFTAIDFDNNGILSPAEFYGALIWLKVPELTAEDVADFIEAADANRDGMIDYKEYMDMLSPYDNLNNLKNETDDPPIESSMQESSRIVIPKIEPYGAEEIREVMVRRKQLEILRIKEERLRRQAYADSLDVKVFEEELEATKLRKGGANPVVVSQPNYRSSEYKFISNECPLRILSTGKCQFIPITLETVFEKPVQPMKCSKNHVLTPKNWYWRNCYLCRDKEVKYDCDNCYYENKGVCKDCYDNDLQSKQNEKMDPSKHSTFMRCLNSCSFSLQIPSAGGADPETGNYLVSLEVRFKKLPTVNTLQTLIRFSLPDIASSLKNRSSAYLNSYGAVVAKPIIKSTLANSASISEELGKIGSNNNSNKNLRELKSDLSVMKKSLSDLEKSVADLSKEKETFNAIIETKKKSGNENFITLTDEGTLELKNIFSNEENIPDEIKKITQQLQLILATEEQESNSNDFDLESAKKFFEDPVSLVNKINELDVDLVPSEKISQIELNLEYNLNVDLLTKFKSWLKQLVSYRSASLKLPDVNSQIETKSIEKSELVKKIEEIKNSILEVVEVNSKTAPKIIPNIWYIISFNVNPLSGLLSCFINGKLSHEARDLDPAELKLQHKLNILGGGKQIHAKGGDIQRVIIQGATFSSNDVLSEYWKLVDSSSYYSFLIKKIQAIYRGKLARKAYFNLKQSIL